MQSIPDHIALALGLILAAWIGIAGWFAWRGSTAERRARTVLRQSSRLGKLLETSPALPLLVRSDGKLEGSARLMGWFGFDEQAQRLGDLVGQDRGLAPDDLAALSEDIALAQKSAKPFARAVRALGSSRSLMIRGGLADPKVAPNGSALLWVFDATDTEEEIAQLHEQGRTIGAAFDNLLRLVEAAPIPMWLRDGEGKLALVNGEYVRAVESTDANTVVREQVELLGSVADDPAGERPLDRSTEPVSRVIAATVQGERRSLRVVSVPLGDAGTAGFAIDIEELVQARRGEKALRDAQRALLDRMSAGVAQFAKDRTLGFCNTPFQRLFAFREAWVAERPEFKRVLDRMREANRTPQVRDFAEWRNEHADWFHASQSVEETWALPNGQHLRVLANPTPDGGLTMIFEDRTEELRLASAHDSLLRARTATFDRLYESVAVFGTDGKLNIWNNQFARDWELDDEILSEHPRVDALMQKMANRLAQPSLVGEVRERVRLAAAERQEGEGRIAFKDGRTFDYGAIPLPDGNALFTMIDVTDSRRIEAALRERNEALVEADAIKASFLSNMSYEFRTPLTSIGGFAELLDAGIAGPLTDQAKEYTDAILSSVKRLGKQIDSVLDLSQSEAGALPIAKEKVNLERLVRACADEAADAAKAKHIELVVDLDGRLGSVMGDRKRLAQALGHVIENAVAYTGEGGRVSVHGEGEAAHVSLHVSDNGPGMSPAQQSRALDGFARSREGDRDGLGLPLARQLIAAHGGKLTLVSEKGEGTLVTIRLPRG